jgi:hypothetical protein
MQKPLFCLFDNMKNKRKRKRKKKKKKKKKKKEEENEEEEKEYTGRLNIYICIIQIYMAK